MWERESEFGGEIYLYSIYYMQLAMLYVFLASIQLGAGVTVKSIEKLNQRKKISETLNADAILSN